ncbi:hypothetical protein Tco_0949371 [Tanacetum coccineum]
METILEVFSLVMMIIIIISLIMLLYPILKFRHEDLFFSIGLGEKEEDSCLVINLSGKVVEYNLISKTLHEIYDIGSNQFDDNLDDDELITPFVADHNVYEFILSFASV